MDLDPVRSNEAAGGSRSAWSAHARRNLLGNAPRFVAALRVAERLARCDATLLIEGETGTGKEVVARAIHYVGSRAQGPFVPVNCGAIPDSLVESELFGHVRGAFTDARDNQAGLIAQADGGTLFLDEIEAMTPRAQVVLMRFLQDREFRQVGGRRTQVANVRILSATNADLRQLVRRGQWREDLLFRLRVVSICLPPLRERGDDVLTVAQAFMERFAVRYGVAPKQLDAATREFFLRYPWPGNVRELENIVHREFVLNDSGVIRIDEATLESPVPDREHARPTDRRFREAKALAVAQFERSYLQDLLQRAQGNLSLAARLSGKERSALGKLVRKHGLAGRNADGGSPRGAQFVRERHAGSESNPSQTGSFVT